MATFGDLPVWVTVAGGRELAPYDQQTPAGRRLFVTMGGEVPPAPVVACPSCGSPLDVDLDAETTTPDGITRRVRAAFCSGCEFVHEF